MKKLILTLVNVLLMVLLVGQLVTSLGVAPGDVELLFKPGQEAKLEFQIINNENKEMSVEIKVPDEYSEIIFIENTTLHFNAWQSIKRIPVKIKYPESLTPGPNVAKITVRETAKNKGMLTAFITVTPKITIFSPYPNKFVRASLQPGIFKPNQPGNFLVEVESLGLQKIEVIKAKLNVEHASKVFEIMESEPIELESLEKTFLKIPWEANVPPGVYSVVASVNYDSEIVRVNKSYDVGKQELKLLNVEVEKYQPSYKATLNLKLKNDWNAELTNGFAEIELVKEESLGVYPTVIESFLGYEEKTLSTYPELESLEFGNYKLIVRIFYNNEISEQEFDLELRENEFVIGDVSYKAEFVQESLLIYLAITLVIFILILITLKFIKKKKPEPLQDSNENYRGENQDISEKFI